MTHKTQRVIAVGISAAVLAMLAIGITVKEMNTGRVISAAAISMLAIVLAVRAWRAPGPRQ